MKWRVTTVWLNETQGGFVHTSAASGQGMTWAKVTLANAASETDQLCASAAPGTQSHSEHTQAPTPHEQQRYADAILESAGAPSKNPQGALKPVFITIIL